MDLFRCIQADDIPDDIFPMPKKDRFRCIGAEDIPDNLYFGEVYEELLEFEFWCINQFCAD